MDRTNVVVLLGTLLLSVVCGAAVGGTRTQLASNEMAIEVYGGYLAVGRGSVNNADNLRFLLDTGASNTRSTAEWRRDLDFTVSRQR
jgi:hypothetical protein